MEENELPNGCMTILILLVLFPFSEDVLSLDHLIPITTLVICARFPTSVECCELRVAIHVPKNKADACEGSDLLNCVACLEPLAERSCLNRKHHQKSPSATW